MSGTKMPARRRAGRATSSASEPAGDGMVQAVYSYNDDNEELVNDSIAGAPSAADAAEQVSGAKVVAAERDAAERRAPGQRSEVLKAMDGENRPGHRVAVEGDVPGLLSGAQRADGDRHKRAREDRAGLRGRSAVQRARAGGAPAAAGAEAPAAAELARPQAAAVRPHR